MYCQVEFFPELFTVRCCVETWSQYFCCLNWFTDAAPLSQSYWTLFCSSRLLSYTSTTCSLATRAAKWPCLRLDHNALVASHPSLSVGWRWRNLRITFYFKIRLGQGSPKYSPYHLNAINQMNPHCNPNNACPSTDLCRRVLTVIYLKSVYSAVSRYNVKMRQDLWLKKPKQT
jgi:hypothetical protein